MSDSKFFYSEHDSDAESMDSAATTLVSLLINAAERGVMVLPPVHL